ncbi:MAG: peptidoglycan DD-metalloendopeptidase family protein [Acidobacteriota bacterium]
MHRRAHLATLALAALLTAHAVGQTARPENSEPDPREAELAELRQEIGRLESRLVAMRGRETSLEDQLARVKVELELQEAQLEEATSAFELAEERTQATTAEVAELETALTALRDDLRRRVVGLYRLGGRGYLRLFLSVEPDADLLPAIRQLRFLALRDQELIDRYASTRDTLDARRLRLVAQREEMDLWRQREQERRDSLVTVRRRQERVLAQVARERQRLMERTRALQDKERKLARLIGSLVDGGLTPLDGTPIQDFRGALDWPVTGEVTSKFGPRLDPRYRTEVPHNGIDIASTAGDPVRSIFPGKVLYAAEFEGYGPMVVVHHPGRVFTLYAGLGELQVGKDDKLALGHILGPATDLLYFEIRVEGQAEDPKHWLR